MREQANAARLSIGSMVSPPTDNIPSPRKRADFPQVFRHERTLANRLRETSRYVGGRNACWCGSRTCARLALHRTPTSAAEKSVTFSWLDPRFPLSFSNFLGCALSLVFSLMPGLLASLFPLAKTDARRPSLAPFQEIEPFSGLSTWLHLANSM